MVFFSDMLHWSSGSDFALSDESYDDSDVIFASQPVRFSDQSFARRLRQILLSKNSCDLVLGNHLGKAIGTKQQYVAGMKVEAMQFRLNSSFRPANEVGHNMPPRMMVLVLRFDKPTTNHVGGQGMVLG
jgi:hypothetical protein